MSIGLNSLLEFARRAMHAHQFGLNIVGNNIANANRPDYSRQRVDIVPSYPVQFPQGSVGTGIEVKGVYRMRDTFIDFKLRQEYSLLGRWTYRENVLSQIETMINEPSESGLGYLMTQFWNSWQDLANEPESGAARSALRHNAELLTERFQYLNSTLRSYQDSMDDDLVANVDAINNLLEQIADLNQKIMTTGDKNNLPNDLLDMRDNYIDELAKLADVEYSLTDRETMTVSIHGRTVVDGSEATYLDTETRIVDDWPRKYIVWKDTREEVSVGDGSIKGLLEIRDEIIPDMIEKLDNLALALVEQINAVHKAGYTQEGRTNIRFFNESTTGASDFELSTDIQDDLNLIATGYSDAPGDNSVVLAIAGLRDQLLMADETQTFEQYYNGIVSDLGLVTQEAKFAKETQDRVALHIENQRQQTMGVSVDEEMVNLIKLQTAYQAATKVITMADELINTVLNMV